MSNFVCSGDAGCSAAVCRGRVRREAGARHLCGPGPQRYGQWSGRVGLMNDEGLLGLVVYVLYFWKERSKLDSGYTRLDDTMIFLLYCSFQDHASL